MLKQFSGLIFGTLLLTITATAQAKMPDKSFACHVTTETDGDGIVLIQAYTVQQASQAASKSKALTKSETMVKTLDVKECIERPKGTFSDSEIQKFYKNMPM